MNNKNGLSTVISFLPVLYIIIKIVYSFLYSIPEVSDAELCAWFLWVFLLFCHLVLWKMFPFLADLTYIYRPLYF